MMAKDSVFWICAAAVAVVAFPFIWAYDSIRNRDWSFK